LNFILNVLNFTTMVSNRYCARKSKS